VIGPLHAAEDRRLGVGSNGAGVEEDSGEKAYDLDVVRKMTSWSWLKRKTETS
jgi:hypothetical protein